MAEHGFWHPQRGYWQTISDPSDEILSSYPEGTVEVPVRPDEYSVWGGTKWHTDTSAKRIDLEKKIRAERDYKLKTEVDPYVTNPLRWNEMSSDNQSKIISYRHALLAIPLQSGFPFDVQWPSKPEV